MAILDMALLSLRLTVSHMAARGLVGCIREVGEAGQVVVFVIILEGSVAGRYPPWSKMFTCAVGLDGEVGAFWAET